MHWYVRCEYLSRCSQWGYNSNSKLACSFFDKDSLYSTQDQFGIISNVSMGACVEDFIYSIYTFLYKSPKHHLKLVKLAQIMETKDNNLLFNIKRLNGLVC